MKTMRSFTIPVADRFTLVLPARSVILSMDAGLGDSPQLWMLIEDDAPMMDRHFRFVSAGQPAPFESFQYVGTVSLMLKDIPPLHLFETPTAGR